MPSMNQPGGFTVTNVCTPPPIRPRLNTSNWNWCTISCWMTSSRSEYAPVKGSTIRCLKNSVSPPTDSLKSSVTTFVCWNSDAEAYRMIGLRPWNWWCNTRDSRAYDRSAMRAASSAAARSRS